MEHHGRLVAGVIGWGVYLVGGWLVLSRLVAGGAGPIEQPAAVSPAFTFAQVEGAPSIDRGGGVLKVLVVSVVDGPMYHCLAPVHLTAADEIMVTSTDFAGLSHVLRECGSPH